MILKRIGLLIVFCLFLVAPGCDDDSSTDSSSSGKSKKPEVAGEWVATPGTTSFPDGFKMDTSSKPYKFYQYSDDINTVAFSGEVSDYENTNSSSGFAVVKITDSGLYGKTVGKYIVVRWKNLSGSTVKESSPYKTDGKNECDSIDEALSEQTIENGYFSFWGDYTKKE